MQPIINVAKRSCIECQHAKGVQQHSRRTTARLGALCIVWINGIRRNQHQLSYPMTSNGVLAWARN
eukprot:6760596-Alexandrium_andersonii.AAC.1